MYPSAAATVLILVATLKVSEGTHHSLFAGVLTDSWGTSKNDQSTQLSLLLNDLDIYYTPHCLRVVIHQIVLAKNHSSATMRGNQSSDTPSPYTSLRDGNNVAGSKANVQLLYSPTTKGQVQESIAYIYKKAEKVNPASCVTYMLSQPPDDHLLKLLTVKGPKNRVTRYFLVHTQNSADADRFLLDHRLGKEENVAALVQEEGHNSSYWRVLIRQLLHPSGSPQVLTVNRWSKDTGLTSTENMFPEQMANFYGQTLTGSLVGYIPYSDFERFEGSLFVKLKPSVNVFIMEALSQQLNFTYEMKMPADGRWGSLDESGHYVGIIGEIEFERAHFALDITVTYPRSQYVDFSEYYSIQAMSFLTPKSRPDPLWRKLITPFRGTVWLCVLVSVGGGSLLYHVIYHAQASLTSSRLLSSHAFMHILASFLSQSLNTYLSLQAGKLFLGFWFLYAFLVTSYYKTSLTSTLTVPFAPPTVDTLEELLHSGLYWAMDDGKGTSYTVFSTSTDPVYMELFKDMGYDAPTAIMNKVAAGQNAFISFTGTLELLQAVHNNNPRRITDIHMARDKLYSSGIACAVPKGAPHLRTFNKVLQRLFKSGLIDKWVRDTLPLYSKTLLEDKQGPQGDEDNKTTNEIKLSLDHLQGPFFILFFGYVGGALLLVLEILLIGVGKSTD